MTVMDDWVLSQWHTEGEIQGVKSLPIESAESPQNAARDPIQCT